MIKLSEVKEALDFVDMNSSCYFNKKTNEILWKWGYNQEHSTYKEDDEYNDDIIHMFDYFTKNDYDIMQKFIGTIDNVSVRNELYNTTRGEGAFTRFRNITDLNGITEKWYEYKDKEYKKISKQWCINNNIEYEEDF